MQHAQTPEDHTVVLVDLDIQDPVHLVQVLIKLLLLMIHNELWQGYLLKS